MMTLGSTILFAQDQVEMADTMRSNGKIYVVVAILLTILFGLIIYLVMLDRKISKVEKQLKS
jgi:hypothetical protein